MGSLKSGDAATSITSIEALSRKKTITIYPEKMPSTANPNVIAMIMLNNDYNRLYLDGSALRGGFYFFKNEGMYPERVEDLYYSYIDSYTYGTNNITFTFSNSFLIDTLLTDVGSLSPYLSYVIYF